MNKITVICVGKQKEDYFQKAQKEYEKRLSVFTKLDVVETFEYGFPDKPNDAEISAGLKKEAKDIEKHISQSALKIALCIEGIKLSSVDLAKYISHKSLDKSHIQFIIGGSYGLDESIKQSADLCLSFSDMTFPHQLMRIILLEQIYRAFKINSNQPYHK